jgi:Dolichyl-phosphate-mannose-protein mannosyltransferase
VTPESPEERRRARLEAGARAALVVIVAGGFALRVWGLGYGLPHPQGRPDEEMLVQRLLGFDTGDPNPHWFMYPTFFLYLLYAWVKIALAAGAAAGAVTGAPLAEWLHRDPATLYVVARALCAVLGTLDVLAAFALGRAVWSVRAGLVAALLVAVSLLHVRDSHFFKPDVAVALATTTTLLAAVRLAGRPTLGAAALAGVACGLGMSVKYSVTLLVPLVVAAFQGGRAGVWRRLAVAGAAALATLVVTSPYMVLDWRTFAGWMAYARFLVRYGGEGIGTGFAYHARYSFLLAHGAVFSLFAVGACLACVRVRPLLPVNAFLAVSAVQLGLSSLAFTRYATPLLPALSVVVGVAFVRLVDRVRSGLPRAAVAAALLTALVDHSLSASIHWDRLAARPDTRILARRWLDAHVAPTAPLLVLGSPWPFTFGDPVLDGLTVRRKPVLDGVAWVLTHEHALAYSHLPPAFAALRPRLRLEAVFSPFTDDGPRPDTVFEMRDAFYLPLAGFDGMVRGGPLIHVYAVEPAGTPPSGGDLEEPHARPPGAHEE